MESKSTTTLALAPLNSAISRWIIAGRRRATHANGCVFVCLRALGVLLLEVGGKKWKPKRKQPFVGSPYVDVC